MTKRCCMCQADKALEEFHRYGLARDGRQRYCKACKAENYRRRKASGKIGAYLNANRKQIERGQRSKPSSRPRYTREYRRAYRLEKGDDLHFRMKEKARAVVSSAIRSGLLVVMACEKCGRPPSSDERKQVIEAHHHKGYTMEHALDVQWLCRHPCHRLADRELSAEPTKEIR